MSEENLEALKRLYGRWAAGDFRDESSLYDPHVVAVSPDPSPEPQYGSQALSDYMRRFIESWEHVRFQATGYRQVGDTVVVNVHRSGIGKGSGAKIEDDAFHVWTFRGRRPFALTYLIAMSEENVEIVRRCYEAFIRGDAETALSAFAPDAEWDDTRFRPEGKVHHGRDEITEVVRMWVGTWTDYSIELERVIDAGDRVVVIYEERGAEKGSGRK